jgi:hypothetical protein
MPWLQPVQENDSCEGVGWVILELSLKHVTKADAQRTGFLIRAVRGMKGESPFPSYPLIPTSASAGSVAIMWGWTGITPDKSGHVHWTLEVTPVGPSGAVGKPIQFCLSSDRTCNGKTWSLDQPLQSKARPIPDDVAEAALVTLVSGPGDEYRCLMINNMDPTDALLASLPNRSPRLVRGSSCHYETLDQRNTSVRTDGDEPAEFLVLSNYTLRDGRIAEIDYAFDGGPWTSHGATLQLEYRDGGWYRTSSTVYEWSE